VHGRSTRKLHAGRHLMLACLLCPQVVFSSTLGGGTTQAYQRVVTEAAVCTAAMHPNIVTTYKTDIKQLMPLQEAGQYLEVAPAAEGGGGGEECDFKL
jgi:hypothetical protein